MLKSTQNKTNRTGMAIAPELAEELLEGAAETVPTIDGDATTLADLRATYAKNAEPIGTMPPPAAGKASGKADKASLVLLDKLGERLAFERSGVRLYDGVLSKLDTFGTWRGGPTRQDLEHIRNEEQEHFLLVKNALAAMGGDPTAVTPSANLHAVASKGLCSVIADPRTNLRESLEALLVAELVDNDAWETLIDLATTVGQPDLAADLQQALEQEREHLVLVRSWLAAGISGAAAGMLAPPFEARADARRRGMLAQAEDAGEGEAVTKAAKKADAEAPKSPSRRAVKKGPAKGAKAAAPKPAKKIAAKAGKAGKAGKAAKKPAKASRQQGKAKPKRR